MSKLADGEMGIASMLASAGVLSTGLLAVQAPMGQPEYLDGCIGSDNKTICLWNVLAQDRRIQTCCYMKPWFV